jgi:hypothetical protein
VQEYTLRKFDASHDEMVLYSYGLGSLALLGMSAVSGELGQGLVFMRDHGRHTLLTVGAYCGCGYLGVTCVAALTKKFGALMSTITTTARKAMTLFLSFFLFPKPATPMHVFGGALFVLGLAVKATPRGPRKRLNSHRKPLPPRDEEEGAGVRLLDDEGKEAVTQAQGSGASSVSVEPPSAWGAPVEEPLAPSMTI